MLTLRGDNGVDDDLALAATQCIDAAMDVIKRPSQGVTNLVKRYQLDCILVTKPFQWHTGYICAKNPLL